MVRAGGEVLGRRKVENMKKRMVCKEIGNVAVDAGLLMVGDPCYFWPDVAGTTKSTHTDSIPDWFGFCDKLTGVDVRKEGLQLNFDRGHRGLGVIVGTTHGDGCYPVFLETFAGGHRRLVVDLD